MIQWLLVAVLGAAPVAAGAPPTPAAPEAAYDTFMKQDRTARHEAFERLTADKKVELMKVHMRRWRDAHHDRLSAAQLQVIDDNLAAIAPEFYSVPTTPEWRDKAVALFQEASEVFTRDQMLQLFTLDGDYVPARR